MIARINPGRPAPLPISITCPCAGDRWRKIWPYRDMPPPDIIECCRTDQIDRFLPAFQHIDINLQPLLCFTGNIELCASFICRKRLHHWVRPPAANVGLPRQQQQALIRQAIRLTDGFRLVALRISILSPKAHQSRDNQDQRGSTSPHHAAGHRYPSVAAGHSSDSGNLFPAGCSAVSITASSGHSGNRAAIVMPSRASSAAAD